jgi:hypothetical protein
MKVMNRQEIAAEKIRFVSWSWEIITFHSAQSIRGTSISGNFMKSILLFKLLCIALFFNFSLSQKVFPKKRSLEIDDLYIEKTIETKYGTFGRTSKLQKYSYNEKYKLPDGDPGEIARLFLKDNFSRFGLHKDCNDLVLTNLRESPAGYHVTFRSTVNHIPIYGADIQISINKQKEVIFVANNYRPHIVLTDTRPSISSDRAVDLAIDYLDVKGKIMYGPKVELMVFDSKSRGPLLVYRVVTVVEYPFGDWAVFIDATNGSVLHVKDRVMYQDGSGLVFNPDPLTKAGVPYGGQYIDNYDEDIAVLNAERDYVVLKDLDFIDTSYRLSGPYCVLTDIEPPDDDQFPELSDPDDFCYSRSDQEFEDVMVYYHIDRSCRRLDSLNFTIPDSLQRLKADPHGCFSEDADESRYVPSLNYCVFGQGGVDDAEDADVIWHEHAHAIQYHIIGDIIEIMSLAILEGSADYWAASYSRSISEYNWGQVFNWDGHNEFWVGRYCNKDWYYPDSIQGKYPYEQGQLWSSVLMKIQEEIGRYTTDQLLIQSYFFWGNNTDFLQAAAAFIQADCELYNNTHLNPILYWFNHYGLISMQDYLPTISHTPLSDCEDLNGPYEVFIDLTPGIVSLDTTNLWLFWKYNDALYDSIPFNYTGSSNSFFREIPGPGFNAWIHYYILVTDSLGNIVTEPLDAPDTDHSFYVGPDTVKPVIYHTKLNDQDYEFWPPAIQAEVYDNIDIESVKVKFFINQPARIDSFLLNKTEEDNIYMNVFNNNFQLNIGDSVFYYILAQDNSNRKNIARDPCAGYYKFNIVDIPDSYVFDFNDNCGGFSANFDWDWGVPDPVMGSGNAGQGNQLWATNLEGNYHDKMHATLISPVLNLSGFTDPRLSFYHFYNMEAEDNSELAYDGGNVKICLNGDTTFSLIHPVNGYPDSICHDTSSNPLGGERVFSGCSGDWQLAEFGLSGYAGKSIRIKFDFASDDSNNKYGWYIDNISIFNNNVTDIDADSDEQNRFNLPRSFVLYQNYPNPFNPETIIKYQLPASVKINLEIYNILGKKVKKLVDSYQSPGYYSIKWDGTDDHGSKVASGIYIYRIQMEKKLYFRKMILLK